MTTTRVKPIAVAAGAGDVLDSLGVRQRLVGEQTGGAIYLFEGEFGPGAGNALHVHRYEDEIGYVLEGRLAVRLGDQNLEVETGGVAFLPKGIPHALHNPLTRPSRYLFAAIPGGSLERCFEAIQDAADAGTLDDTVRRQIFLTYGVQFLE